MEKAYLVEGIPLEILADPLWIHQLIRKTFPGVGITSIATSRNRAVLVLDKQIDSVRIRAIAEWHATKEFTTVTQVTEVTKRNRRRMKAPKTAKEFPVVVKGVTPKLSEAELKAFLQQDSTDVLQVIRLRSAATKSPTHRIKVIYNNKESADRALRSGVTIGFSRRTTELYKEQDYPFCGRCLTWGHKGRECHQPGRCYRCGGTDHKTSSCEQQERQCANCQGGHSSAYRGCPAFKTYRQQSSGTQVPVTPAAAATVKSPTPDPSILDGECMEITPDTPVPTSEISQQTEPILTSDVTTQFRPPTKNHQAQTRPTTSVASTQTDPMPPATTPIILQPFTTTQMLILSAGLLYHTWDEDIRLILSQDFLMIFIMALKLDITYTEIQEFADAYRDLFKRLRTDFRNNLTATTSSAAAEIRELIYPEEEVELWSEQEEEETFQTVQATTTVPQPAKPSKKSKKKKSKKR